MLSALIAIIVNVSCIEPSETAKALVVAIEAACCAK